MPRHSDRLCVGGVLLLTVVLGSAGGAYARTAKATFGLVIGTNRSHDPKVKTLRYADDDAVQNAMLLTEFGGQVVLLAELDAHSRTLYPDVKATAPTRAAVRQALERLNAMMTDASKRGLEPILYIFYSGHGDVENNEGYINLKDGRLWRREFLKLLHRSRAVRNHVIIDACKSYFLVFDRGTGGTRSPLVAPLLDDPKMLPPNTGFFLSTSAAVDSHEWEAFQGGVFSHEVRSAMRGAADHNLDGKVTYEEAGAFVWSANRSVLNARFRPNVFSRPPGGSSAATAVLVQVSSAGGDRLHVGTGNRDHLYIEDENGLRLVDFRPSPGQKMVLLLPVRRPLFVRSADVEREVELPEGREVHFAALSPRQVTVARRGAEHVAFRRLFANSFDASAIVAYRKRPLEIEDIEQQPADLTWLRRSLGIGAAVFAAVGGTMTTLAAVDNRSVSPLTTGIERQEVNDRIDRYNVAAITLYALATGALAAYLTWTLWPEKQVSIDIMPARSPGVQMSIGF